MKKPINPHALYLSRLAKDCGGNTVTAAKQIGISRQLANDLKTGHRDVGACEKALKWLRLRKVVTFVPFLLLLWAVPVAAQTPAVSQPSLKWELAIFTALQTADVVTTRMAITRGSQEGNPIMRPFTGSTVKLSLVKGGVTLLVIGMSKLALKYGHGKDMRVSLWLSNAIMAFVVGNNVVEIRRLGGRGR